MGGASCRADSKLNTLDNTVNVSGCVYFTHFAGVFFFFQFVCITAFVFFSSFSFALYAVVFVSVAFSRTWYGVVGGKRQTVTFFLFVCFFSCAVHILGCGPHALPSAEPLLLLLFLYFLSPLFYCPSCRRYGTLHSTHVQELRKSSSSCDSFSLFVCVRASL